YICQPYQCKYFFINQMVINKKTTCQGGFFAPLFQQRGRARLRSGQIMLCPSKSRNGFISQSGIDSMTRINITTHLIVLIPTESLGLLIS
ncbi:hypothetical protein M3A07_26740, partial [Klebsiella pneumoniae]|uniref:hypothetical protein n=1 Tax=Klebsiella pneumoniae TaxID=573 RepID=UPI00200C21E4